MLAMGDQRRKRARTVVGRQGAIAALDIGSAKITCLVARPDPAARGARIIGVGHHLARGFKAGAVVNMAAAEEAIASAIAGAEHMAGVPLDRVVLGLASPALASRHHEAEIAIGGRVVTGEDVARVLHLARAPAERGEERILHTLPVRFLVDGHVPVKDPRGMFAGELSARLHVVSTPEGPLRNLIHCVERCHIEIAALVASPYASGLACLVPDELDLGVTLIDMGGGSTAVAIFSEGQLQFAGVVPVGGQHVTLDIARGLSTPLAYAERLKTLHGSALAGPADDRDVFGVPQIGEEEADSQREVSRAMLNAIVLPRLEETFELVRDLIRARGLDEGMGRRIVLTGGASQLPGMRELAARILGRQARLARPHPLDGLPEATSGPAFSAGAGLVDFALRLARGEDEFAPETPRGFLAAPMERFGRWLGALI